MLGILQFLVFGLIVGALARFLLPGRQSMGLFSTALVGVVGSFLGGTVGTLLAGGNLERPVATGWIGSVLGTIALLLLTSFFRRASSH
jgi:uncharacterized membrane protein YeaQ/YmgE (transglycosylase-associated protein family)